MGITRSKFIEDVRRKIGTRTDADGVYGAQCVDLVKYFIKKYWGLETWGNAIDYASNKIPDGFKRYRKGDISVQAGDILVWKWSIHDNFGHVGICVETHADGTVTSVEQNVDGNADYLSVGGPARLKTRNTSCLVSIIRPNFAAEPTESTQSKKSVDEIAREVINGKWGNGSDRVARLKSAGYDPEAVQRRVNAMLSGSSSASTKKSTDEIAKEVLAGKWGNGGDRKERLTKAGYDYDAVQRRVNQLL